MMSCDGNDYKHVTVMMMICDGDYIIRSSSSSSSFTFNIHFCMLAWVRRVHLNELYKNMTDEVQKI